MRSVLKRNCDLYSAQLTQVDGDGLEVRGGEGEGEGGGDGDPHLEDEDVPARLLVAPLLHTHLVSAS